MNAFNKEDSIDFGGSFIPNTNNPAEYYPEEKKQSNKTDTKENPGEPSGL